MKARDIPNIITIARILLVVPFIYYLAIERYHVAFFLFMAAGFSDSLDGFLARRFHWSSKLGSFLDPIADKLLMMSSFSIFLYTGLIPFWLFLIVIARDVIIISGVTTVMLVRKEILEMQPTFISKLNTVLQLFFIFITVLNLSYFPVPDAFSRVVMGVLVLSALASVTRYIIMGTRMVIAYYQES